MTRSDLVAAPDPIDSDDSPPERVLLVSDQSLIADLVKVAVNHGPFTLRQAMGVQEVLTVVPEWRPHILLVDMERQAALLEALSADPRPGRRVPILALMARGQLEAWLSALEQGADDIILVPFTAEELVARMLAVLRRAYGRPVRFTPVIRVGPLEIDLIRRCVYVDGVTAELTFIELSVLYLMIANAGRLMTRDEILTAAWGPDYASESNLVDQYVHSLRTKLRDDWREPRFIATVPGQGYRFLVTETAEPAPGSVLISLRPTDTT